jgi:PAS domain S-box-containing protein
MHAAPVSILNAVSIPLIVVRHNTILYLNAAAAALLHYATSDTGLAWSRLVRFPAYVTPVPESTPQPVILNARGGEQYSATLTLADIDWEGQPARLATLVPKHSTGGDELAQTEAALRQHEERLRIMQELLPANTFCVVATDDGGYRLDWISPTFFGMSGYTMEELSGSLTLYHPDEHARVRQHIDDAWRGKGGKHEYRALKKSGEEYWISVNRSPVWDAEQRRVTHFYGVTQDITDYKRVEAQLRQSEERYRLISELISDYAYSFAVQPDGTLVHEWITDSFFRMTGYTADEIDRQGVFALFAPGEQERVSEHIEDVLAGKGGGYEYRIITKSGATRWLHIHRQPVWDEYEGRVVRFYGVAQDITERKLSEEALRLSEERHRIISSLISDYAFSYHVLPDRSIQLEWVTDSLFRHTGYSREERRAMGLLAIYAPEYRPQIQAHLEEVIDGKKSEHEYRIITKSGEERWTRVTRTPVWDEQEGRVVRFYGVVQDITERKLAEEALRLSETRYRVTTELISDYAFSFAVAPDYSVTWEWVTDSVMRHTGFSKEELYTMPPFGLYAPDDRARVQKDIQAVFEGREIANEYRMTTKSGETRWVRIIRKPVWSAEESRVVRFYGVSEDVTERKLAEEALRLSEERYRIVAEIISDYAFCFRVNPDGSIENEWTTESADRITGYSKQERVARGLMGLYPPEDHGLIRHHLQAVINGEESGHDYRIITKDGDTRWLHIHRQPVWDEREGRVVRFYGVAQDITERKLSEQAMRESEEKYRLIAENVTDMITKHALDGRYTYISPAIIRLLGYQPEDLLGHTPREYIHPDDVTDAGAVRPSLLQNPTIPTMINTFRMRKKSGSYTWMESTTSLIFDPQSGDVVELIAVSRDVSERKAMEQALVERERLEAALQNERAVGEMKTSLMRTLSHEFRTPLSLIQISVDIFERYFERLPVEKRHERLNVIREQVRRLTDMLDDISFVIGGTMGSLRFQPLEIDLIPLIEQRLDELRATSGQSHVIHLEVSGTTGYVRIDQVLVTRILNNLVSNALKYSPDNTDITVQVNGEARGIFIRVIDSGIGIPTEDVEHVFEPFYRASNVGAIGGTGLGLNVVRECVALHGGQISVESRENIGTTFSVWLPFSMP